MLVGRPLVLVRIRLGAVGLPHGASLLLRSLLSNNVTPLLLWPPLLVHLLLLVVCLTKRTDVDAITATQSSLLIRFCQRLYLLLFHDEI